MVASKRHAGRPRLFLMVLLSAMVFSSTLLLRPRNTTEPQGPHLHLAMVFLFDFCRLLLGLENFVLARESCGPAKDGGYPPHPSIDMDIIAIDGLRFYTLRWDIIRMDIILTVRMELLSSTLFDGSLECKYPSYVSSTNGHHTNGLSDTESD